jgi:hypothetical protein
VNEKGQAMVAKQKKRVVLSIDEDVWSDFQGNLKKRGYPRGTASWVVQQQFERFNIEFEVTGDSQQLDLMFSTKLE